MVTMLGRGSYDPVVSNGEVDPLTRVEKALDARGPTRMSPGHSRIHDLLGLLGDPHRAYPSIHLTGTNGKTSTTRMIDTLLGGLGLRTGRYISPHLESITERIAIDGQPLSNERFAEVYDEIEPFVDIVDGRHDPGVSYFEVVTAMAFAAFADAPVDVAVVEVGLGGRFDTTNVLHAPVAVITPISLDHTQVLGSTVAEIAADKAGIVYDGATLVTAQQPPEAAEVLLRRAVEVGATVAREGMEFGVVHRSVAVGGQLLTLQGLAERYDDVFLPLHGAHQAGNAACALAAVEAFLGVGAREPLAADIVRDAFASVESPGRLEVLRRGPTVIVDGAHNPAGADVLVAGLQEAFAFRRIVGVVAVLGDKDVAGILAALEPLLAEVVVTQNSSPRAMPVDDLAALAAEVFGEDRVTVASRLDEAIDEAIRLAEDDPSLVGDAGVGVLVTGSIVTVGEARRLLRPTLGR
jgi:dihydrofolate synthase/folylpolyglutamate synthase